MIHIKNNTFYNAKKQKADIEILVDRDRALERYLNDEGSYSDFLNMQHRIHKYDEEKYEKVYKMAK